MKIRRLQRIGTANVVVNVVLSRMKSDGVLTMAMEVVQDGLRDFAIANSYLYNEMSNGDLFLLAVGSSDAKKIGDSVSSLLAEQKAASHAPTKPVKSNNTPTNYVVSYLLPTNYTQLRERLLYYTELAQNAANVAISRSSSNAPAQALKGVDVRGPLTAWSAYQIELLLNEIDLSKYMNSQSIYTCRDEGKNTVWQALFVENFISFYALKRNYFPNLDVSTRAHLFLDLCRELDNRLLAKFMEHPGLIGGKKISLNLSVTSIVGSALSSFAHSIPKGDRGNIIFELHCGDLFQDFAMAVNTISLLSHEGFKIALDGITPDILPYCNFDLLVPDYIKLNMAAERHTHLAVPQIREALLRLPMEKVIFFRCENQRAILTGKSLGVTMFQGFAVDEAATGKSGKL